ncbi:MAG: GNAT family N-acetyltransferase [Telmatospirillum sp.]|nr:GNAT family N-acetyltransferase [Telmatospirillum sp.]
MILRPARPADFPALATIAAAAYRVGFADLLPPSALARFDFSHFALRFALETVAPTLAEADNAVLGFHLTQARHIKMLFIDPARRKQGIAAALLADAEANGAATLESFRDNAPARRFYERHGWRCVREYTRAFDGIERAFVAYEKPSAEGRIGMT